MGYCYTNSGQLVCDHCNCAVGVKKRTCPHKVGSLPYCSPPALCKACYEAKGGARLHDRCKEPAERSRQREAARKAMLDAGHFERSTAWGDWHETVPTGKVGVRFVAGDGREEYRLLPEATYNAHNWLHEFTDAEPWNNHA